jgi:hypothetical protein
MKFKEDPPINSFCSDEETDSPSDDVLESFENF